MKKRLFALLICIAVVFGLFAISAHADDTYTVSFDTQGRGSAETLTISAGYPVPGNIKPVGDDGTMCFRGWLLNGSAYDLSTPVNSDITLVANWQQHTWDSGSITKESTCRQEGLRTFTCTVTGCEGTKTEAIAVNPNAHDFSGDPVITAATCTSAGSEVRTCLRDGCSATDTKTLEALGHDWGEWQVTTAATCTGQGEETRTCQRCGSAEHRPLSALGHNWGDWETTTMATCTEKGQKTRQCSRCNDEETDEIPALGHEFVNNVCTVCEAKRASVTVTIQGSGTGTLNGANIVSGETVYLNDGQKVSMVFTPAAGYQLTDILENGQARSSLSMPYEYNATAGTPDFQVRAVFSQVASKTVAEPRQVLVTSGTAYTRAGTLASVLANIYHLSDTSSIKYHVYDVTPIWSDGSEMSQDEIEANGGVSFTMAAPDGTSEETHRYVVYHLGTSGTISVVSSSLSVTTEDFSPFAAFAIPLSASPGTVVVDPDSKTTPNPPTVTPVNMERVDDKVSKTGGFSVLNAAYPIEYRQDGSTAGYISVTGNTVSGLTAGRYYVRYAATATTNASGDTLTPIVIDDYYTVSTKLLYGKGTVYSDDSAGYADNVYLVKKGNDITFRFEPASHYWLHEIRINDQYVGQSNVKTPYVLRNVTKHVDLAYGFSDSSASPKTGDESNIGLWIAVGAVSAVAIAGIAFYLIKKRK